MSITTQKLTAEELWELPNHNNGYELVRGELVMMTPAGFGHGRIGLSFGFMLLGFVKANKLGEVVGAETGFILSKSPDTVRAPDIALVRRERITDPDFAKFWDGAPDLAVEVVSPGDTVTEIDEKTQDYLNAGTVEVIVINPKLKSVKIFRRSQTATVLGLGDVLENLDSVPGFRCTIDEIFATN